MYTGIYTGCPMWYHPEWKGRLFPTQMGQEQAIGTYSQYLNSIEGNTTFYHLPSTQSVARWANSTPDAFRFTFKLPRAISHQAHLTHAGDAITEFYTRLAPLEDKVGCVMLQLPASFSPQALPQLEAFLSQLPTHWPIGVEVRHIGFFGKDDDEKRFNQLLIQRNCNRIIMDTRALFSRPANGDARIADAQSKKPKVPVHAIATSTQPIVRFVGHSGLEQNQAYYQPWIHKIYQWQQEGKQPYIFFHTASNGEAPWLAEKFFKEMKLHYPDANVPALSLPRVSHAQSALF